MSNAFSVCVCARLDFFFKMCLYCDCYELGPLMQYVCAFAAVDNRSQRFGYLFAFASSSSFATVIATNTDIAAASCVCWDVAERALRNTRGGGRELPWKDVFLPGDGVFFYRGKIKQRSMQSEW